MLSGYLGQRALDVSWGSGWKENGNKLMFFIEALVYGRSYDGIVKLGIRARKSPEEIMQYQQMIEAITESSRSCRGESCGVLLRGYCARKQQQRERQQQHPHQHLEPFGLKRIGSSRRQEQKLGAMGPCRECSACGADVFADYTRFCLPCGLRLPLTPSYQCPSPSPSPV